ncbi:MAG: hypothetical protein ACLPLZ_05550 [Terracidiphilus sp.]
MNRGIMFVTIAVPSEEIMESADEWARTLKQANEAKQAETDKETQRTAMNRNIIAQQMPTVWEDLIKEFQKYCNAYNEQFKPERLLALHRSGSCDFFIRPDALEEIVIGHYSYENWMISISTRPGVVEWFEPQVYQVGAGKVELASRGGRGHMSLESIAGRKIKEGLAQAGLIAL